MIHGKFFCMLDVGEWAFPPSDCATGLYLAVLAISLFGSIGDGVGEGESALCGRSHSATRPFEAEDLPAARWSHNAAAHLFSPPVVAAGGQHSPLSQRKV